MQEAGARDINFARAPRRSSHSRRAAAFRQLARLREAAGVIDASARCVIDVARGTCRHVAAARCQAVVA